MEVLDLEQGDLFTFSHDNLFVYEVVEVTNTDFRIKQVAMKISGQWKIKSACDIIQCNRYSRCRKVVLDFIL